MKAALGALQLVESRSAYVRSRIWLLQVLEHGSPFYTLGKQRGAHQQLSVLLANDGSLVSDLEGIRVQIHTYYVALSSLDPSSKDARREKACDGVNQKYLLGTVRVFRSGMQFVSGSDFYTPSQSV
eukprot:g19683.t1